MATASTARMWGAPARRVGYVLRAPAPPRPVERRPAGQLARGHLSQWLFLRGLGLSFLLAFASLWPQLLVWSGHARSLACRALSAGGRDAGRC